MEKENNAIINVLFSSGEKATSFRYVFLTLKRKPHGFIGCAASCLVRERYLKLIAFSPEEKNTFTFVVFSFYDVDNLAVGFTTPSFTARF